MYTFGKYRLPLWADKLTNRQTGRQTGTLSDSHLLICPHRLYSICIDTALINIHSCTVYTVGLCAMDRGVVPFVRRVYVRVCVGCV